MYVNNFKVHPINILYQKLLLTESREKLHSANIPSHYSITCSFNSSVNCYIMLTNIETIYGHHNIQI